MGLELRQSLAAHHSAHCLAISPDGGTLATGGYDRGSIGNTVKLWDAAGTLALRHRLRGHKGEVSAVAFSPDGGRVASVGRDGTLRLWGVGTGEPLWSAKGHAGAAFCVAFHPGGDAVATGGRDGWLLWWDAHAGQVRRAMGVAGGGPAGGGVLATAGRDGRVNLWHAGA